MFKYYINKESKNIIFSIAEYISNGKNLEIVSTDSSLKDKCIAYYLLEYYLLVVILILIQRTLFFLMQK